MKYLKLFEEKNTPAGDYFEIERGEFHDLLDKETHFKTDEISEIRSALPKGYFVKEDEEGYGSEIKIVIRYSSDNFMDRMWVWINKSHDEWFLVQEDKKVFKCDQISGLISYIKDNIPKQNPITENYYEKLDDLEYYSLRKTLHSNLEEFNQEEIKMIESKLPKDAYISMSEPNVIKIYKEEKSNRLVGKQPVWMWIDKLKDEWYIILDNFKYGESVKCDQITGVLKYIEDNS